jgi:cyclohexadienyl dehydratase
MCARILAGGSRLENPGSLIGETVALFLETAGSQNGNTWLLRCGIFNKYDVAVGGITQTVTRMAQVDFLPLYAPFGKVALIRTEDRGKFETPESLNQETVRVIKTPGGTNEKYVLENLTKAQVATHEKNAEIPGLIAEGKGDVMITETYEALLYSKKDRRLYAAFVNSPLTPTAFMGFMLPLNDPDFIRVMKLVWTELELRGELAKCAGKWLQ